MRYTLVVVWGFICECCAAWRVGVWRVRTRAGSDVWRAKHVHVCQNVSCQ